MKFYSLAAMTFLLLFTSCKKEKDFRDKYCGNWHFEIKRSFFIMYSTYTDTVYYYMGNIWYETKDSIIIQYRESSKMKFHIDETGEIDIKSYYGVFGKFSGDSIVTFGYHTGGMGGGSNVSVKGTKE